jgi:[NiFe] hydrogenase diaphorase moiety small subunit
VSTAPPTADGTFLLDGHEVPFTPGQTLLQAALAAGDYVPHLCFHPDFPPHGSCRVCVVRVDGRPAASCTTPAAAGLTVESATPEVRADAKALVEFLFTEGDHFCPSCEQSGRCTLQAVGYELGVDASPWHPMFPDRPLDASHPDVWLDFDRCILCELCVRASADLDGKHVFALSGRGIGKRLIVNAESGRLADTPFSADDAAARVCPVGVILPKRRGFDVPIGERTYDRRPIREVAPARARAGHPEEEP